MPSYPCATRGSVKSSHSTTKPSPSWHKSRSESKSHTGGTRSKGASSSKTSHQAISNDHTSLLEVMAQEEHNSSQYNESASPLTADHLDQPSSHNVTSLQASSYEYDYSASHPTTAQIDGASAFSPSSTDLPSIQALPTEYGYSLTRFTSSTALHPKYTYKSSKESIQAHTTTVEVFLDDFDTVFYHD